MKQTPTSILTNSNLRKTPIRLQVLQLLLREETALSSQQLESNLHKPDRITLYRTLRTFEQKGIVHQVVDGTNNPKYALCLNACNEHQHLDQHAHFHCVQCGKTICLTEVSQPSIHTPAGFVVQSSHLALQGFCPDCIFKGKKKKSTL
ncbi:MAG: transcriptional repressor [Saprospirales bacterium]|nr:transcriptional repressor [Saprospirales bacterium]MBK8489530.1 transcriptional repressor [Saprospirales bacterium]